MTKHNSKHLTIYNIENYLSQINKNTTKDTKCKFLMRAARVYYKAGSTKHMRHALNLFEEAYNIVCDLRGIHDPKSYTLAIMIDKCNSNITRLKNLAKEQKKNK